MPTDQLYDIAFRFRKTKLWKKLYDSQLFAVRHEDGEIGYCCVMGMLGEHLALAVYSGDAGMDSYRMMGKDHSMMHEAEMHEIAFAQNCAMCSFENKDELRPRELDEVRRYCEARQIVLRGRKAYPQFQRFKPHYYPWYLDDATDRTRVREGLEACLEVSRRLEETDPEELGFTEGAPYERNIPLLEKKDGVYHWSTIPLPEPVSHLYPSAGEWDEMTFAKLRKIKKHGGEWACDVFMHMQAISDEAGDGESVEEPKNAPFFPYLLLIVDNESGDVLHAQLSSDPEDYTEEFAKTMAQAVQTNGRPTRILVCNERTQALLQKLAEQLGTQLLMKTHVPLLDEARISLMERFGADEDSMDEQMEEIMGILSDGERIKELPDRLLLQIAQAVQEHMLPEDIGEHVRGECRRRKL